MCRDLCLEKGQIKLELHSHEFALPDRYVKVRRGAEQDYKVCTRYHQQYMYVQYNIVVYTVCLYYYV